MLGLNLKTFAAAMALIVAGAADEPADCCRSTYQCHSVGGKTDDGMPWCYAYISGTTAWTHADTVVAKCLANEFKVQDNPGKVPVNGSPCTTGGSDIQTMWSYTPEKYQVRPQQLKAIQAAISAAEADKVVHGWAGAVTFGALGWDSYAPQFLGVLNNNG
ncbi:hypothetical protein V494_04964 [Pseudogymnoascus sp. VKM F-4513 (FW-928)]|nr:hypothetical protein V494_04964 [Pseudogymnoascus sp. VKM F-4513 (FW-928)]